MDGVSDGSGAMHCVNDEGNLIGLVSDQAYSTICGANSGRFNGVISPTRGDECWWLVDEQEEASGAPIKNSFTGKVWV